MFRRMKTKYYIIAFLMLCSNLLFADGIKFRASASKSQVSVGEPFQIIYSLNGNGSRFIPPDLDGFQILSGPNVSSSISSINGVTSVQNSYNYILAGTKEGDYTIPPAFMIHQGSRLSSNSLTIQVVKGQAAQQNYQGQGSSGGSRVTLDNTTDINKLLFIKAVVDKRSVYQGEQLTLIYRLYTRVNIGDSRVDRVPDLNGFWSQDVKAPQTVQWRTENYNGQVYNVADLKQTVLFPEHSGKLTIDAFQMTFIASVPVASNDPMDDLLGGNYKQIKHSAKSAPLTIDVKPLPEAGKPAGFTGAVGQFSVAAGIDRQELKTNESLNYTLKVTGSGNLKLLKTLSADFPPDFEKYDPKLTDTLTQTATGISGSRAYTYLLIPRHAGDYTIAPVKFSYFNPATNKYVSLSSKSFKIKVNKGAVENNVTALSTVDKLDVKLLDNDIRYIKIDNAAISKVDDGFYGSAWYILLLAAGPLLCVAAFIYRNRNREFNNNHVLVKNRRASKEAAKHLAHAQKQLKAKNTKEFYDAIFKGIYGYLGDKLNILAADLNKETIVLALKARSVNDQLIDQLIETLDLCEMARYAPVTQISEEEMFEKAKGIIKDIDNEIK